MDFKEMEDYLVDLSLNNKGGFENEISRVGETLVKYIPLDKFKSGEEFRVFLTLYSDTVAQQIRSSVETSAYRKKGV
jgi:hypothetical protein